jgi:hypothetical protein
MVHDIEVPLNSASAPSEDRAHGPSSAFRWSDKSLTAVHDPTLDVVSAISTNGSFDANPALEELLTPILRSVNLPESSRGPALSVTRGAYGHRERDGSHPDG